MNPVIVEAPASKSMSHRALIAAALSRGETTLTRVLDSDDLQRTSTCLEAVGARISGTSTVNVVGTQAGPVGGKDEPASLYMHESGTSCRLLTGVMGAGKGKFRVHGAPRMHERPIGALTDALESQGVDIHFESAKGFPPFVMDVTKLSGGDVSIPLEESSQYLSGLLLAAPFAETTTIINVAGRKVVSWPYVALTLQVMRDFGINFSVQTMIDGEWKDADFAHPETTAPGTIRFIVEPSPYRTPETYAVEGDWSNASYFLAAGALGPCGVTVKGLKADSLQGDKAIAEILEKMGAQITFADDAVTAAPPATGKLKGITVDMGACPDLVPTVVAVAAFAEGDTTITNVAHLRIKECDRLAAPAAELAKVGGGATIGDDNITIHPAPVKAGAKVEFKAYGDHRMAMSTALYSLRGINGTVDDPECVGKSFPEFWKKFAPVLKANGV
ncbi:MAG: 3-phosphoshikimate 1-carboxyvinyltransferase [Desulfovibrio sp.]